jgi:hypothetical protein
MYHSIGDAVPALTPLPPVDVRLRAAALPWLSLVCEASSEGAQQGANFPNYDCLSPANPLHKHGFRARDCFRVTSHFSNRRALNQLFFDCWEVVCRAITAQLPHQHSASQRVASSAAASAASASYTATPRLDSLGTAPPSSSPSLLPAATVRYRGTSLREYRSVLSSVTATATTAPPATQPPRPPFRRKVRALHSVRPFRNPG